MNMVRHLIPLLILLPILLLSGISLHAEGIVFFDGTWDEALELAAKENKYIMVDAYTDWCGWCKVMEKKTFTDAEVAAVVNENFVPIRIDFEKGIGVDLGMKFRVSSYPTILFFNPSGQLVHIEHGYLENNQDFIAECRKALAIQDERVFAFDSRDLEPGFPEFYRTSFLKGDERAWPEQEEVIAFLDKQEDLFSEASWSVIWRFGGGEKYQRYLLAHLDEYKSRYGKGEVTDAAFGQIETGVYQAAKAKDSEKMHATLALLDTYSIREDQDFTKLLLEQAYYEWSEDWPGYIKASERMMGHEKITVNQINSLCWNIYEKIDDQANLEKAVGWMEQALEKEPGNWMYIDTYAALLYKSGNLAEAGKQAREAIRIGKEEGDDVSGTEELLKKINAGGVKGS